MTLVRAAGGNVKKLPSGMKVKWPDFFLETRLGYTRGVVIDGPFKYTGEDRLARQELGWPVTPYHTIRGKDGTIHSVITSCIKPA
jgi:hypothetical protein